MSLAHAQVLIVGGSSGIGLATAQQAVAQGAEVTIASRSAERLQQAGQIVVVPAGVPHKFCNSGAAPLRQIDIHRRPRFITAWLED